MQAPLFALASEIYAHANNKPTEWAFDLLLTQISQQPLVLPNLTTLGGIRTWVLEHFSEITITITNQQVSDSLGRAPLPAVDHLTIVDIAAFLVAPDEFEYAAWGVKVAWDPDSPTGINIPLHYAAVLSQFAQTATTDENRQDIIDEVGVEINSVREELKKDITESAVLAKRMRNEATRRGVLDGQLWNVAFGGGSDFIPDLFYSPYDRERLKQVFKAFLDNFLDIIKRDLKPSFTDIYNLLLTDGDRQIIAMAGFMVPKTAFYGWPTSVEASTCSYFRLDNSKRILLDVLKEDTELSGKQLARTIKFP